MVGISAVAEETAVLSIVRCFAEWPCAFFIITETKGEETGKCFAKDCVGGAGEGHFFRAIRASL